MTDQAPPQGNGVLNPGPTTDSPSSGSLICIPLTESDVEESARLYTEVFLAEEPVPQGREPDPVWFLNYSRQYARYLAGKNLSFVVRDQDTHHLAGFIFCNDMADTPESVGEWVFEILAEFREVITMITELEDRHINRQKIVPGSMLHLVHVGVSQSYRGKGLAQLMTRKALAHAQERGFSHVIADCINQASRHSCEKCGFHEAGFSSYEAFSLDGDRPFAGREGGIFLMLMDM
ncbi:MAG: GNAT family N-acetyltransferase [Methanoregula sp.]